MQCWHHISSFNNFQQTVFLIQTNLQTAAATIVVAESNVPASKNSESSSVSAGSPALLSLEPETISISDDEDENDEESNNISETETGNHNLFVTDCEINFEAGPYTMTSATLPEVIINDKCDNRASSANEQNTEDNAQFISNDVSHCNEYWDIETLSDSDESIGILQERTPSQNSADCTMPSTSATSTAENIRRKLQSCRKDKITSQQIDETIAKWIPVIKCRLCPRKYKTFTELRKHFSAVHPSDVCYVKCCEGKFRYRYRLEEHVLLHLNPYAFTCEHCNKPLLSRSSLYIHRQICRLEEK
ncbi:uncharacterized protein isoform X2 [Musca autumnalis]